MPHPSLHPRAPGSLVNRSTSSSSGPSSRTDWSQSSLNSRKSNSAKDRWRFPPEPATSNMHAMHRTGLQSVVPGDATIIKPYFPTTDPLVSPFTHDSELIINVHGIPQMLGTADVYRLFNQYGNIEHISLPIYEQGKTYAKVRFSPNPLNAGLNRLTLPKLKEFVMSSGHTLKLRLEVQSPRRLGALEASLNLLGDGDGSRIHVDVSKISLGFPQKEDHVQIMRSAEGSGTSFEVDLSRGRRQIKLSFSAKVGHSAKFCRVEIPMQHMDHIKQTLDSETHFDYLFSLKSAPPVWLRPADDESSFTHAQTTWNVNHSWVRATDDVLSRSDTASTPLSLNDPALIKFGSWLTYRIIFTKAQVPSRLSTAIKQILQANNISISPATATFSSESVESVWNWVDRPMSTAVGNSAWLSELMSTTPVQFEVRYQLEACVSQGFLSEYTITRPFMERLNSLSPKEATQRLAHLADTDRRLFDPMDLFSINVPPCAAHDRIPSYCTLLRSVTVTPTHIYVSQPTVEMSNRVIRQYAEHQDRFLRVRFTDERSEGKIWARADGSNDLILDRVRRTLLQGIVVGGRHYDLLASGNSQFRDHGAFFFSANASLDAQKIRDWIGDLKTITSVPKYISRMGQCFATTRAINSSKVELRTIDDVSVKSGNPPKRFLFTDGVGKISKFLAQMIATELRLPAGDPPSLFQFRLGGCKGVLAVAPDATGRQIHIRESQYKFPALHTGLEIIRCSSFSAAELNRQLITILTCLGIGKEVFLRKVRDQIRDISHAIEDPQVAIDQLHRRIDQNQMTLEIAKIISDGFLEAHDPFAFSVLDLWRSWSLKRLKEKARIFVKDGAFVLGCTDETKRLRGHWEPTVQGRRADITRALLRGAKDVSRLPQIFIQVDSDRLGQYKVVQGICIVARNPSLEPGDIRVVMAVDIPELHHHRNTVVFPQTGDRDLPSMCSGGDLDGDDFFVSWDPELIPPEWNHKPGDFLAPSPILKHDIGVRDLADFYVDYMRNDNLGRIANQWQAIADHDSLGAKSVRCRALARLHSEAVDFVKSGQPAILDPKLKPDKWPHFMPSKYRPSHQIYRSKTVLGRLYDEVQTRDYHPHLDQPFDARVLGAYDLDEETLNTAKLLKNDYDTAMRRIMKQHDISTEFEVWTAFCLDHNILSGDYKFQEQLGELSSTLKERYQDLCINAAGGKDFTKLAPFVTAMYTVTARETSKTMAQLSTMERTQSQSLPFISFPWLFPDVLGKIVRGPTRPAIEQIRASQAAHAATMRAARPKVPKLIDMDAQDIEVTTGTVHADELLDLDFAFRSHPTQEDDSTPALDSGNTDHHFDAKADLGGSDGRHSVACPDGNTLHSEESVAMELALRPKSRAETATPGTIGQAESGKREHGEGSMDVSARVDTTSNEMPAMNEPETANPTSSPDPSSLPQRDETEDEDEYSEGEVKIVIPKKQSVFDRLRETVAGTDE